ncbi:hypothetical protein NA78x_000223 [Anatilimnocola sp. NA78]|uniref:acyltransferase n=1 Tax=Anatilimnocola sp. NA78 TaxID=3415683 RepID=UPI003CE4A8CD
MRQIAKLAANGFAAAAVFPLLLMYWSAALIVGSGRAFPGWSQAMCVFPGTIGAYLRRSFYAGALPRVGTGSVISFGTVFSHPSATIGKDAYVGLFCCLGDVDLADDVLVGSHVSIMNGSRQHGTSRLDIPVREQPGVWPRIAIGQDSWIGDRAVVMADVGEHCIVGAGSVVTRPVPDYAIVVGSPARIVGDRRDQVTQLSDIAKPLSLGTQMRILVPGE